MKQPRQQRAPKAEVSERAPLSLRGFARAMGVRLQAVQDAIVRGVLDESIVVVAGRRKIDPLLGAREWHERANPIRRANGEKLRERFRSEEEEAEEELDELSREALEHERTSLAAAVAKRMRWAAERERLTVVRMRTELVDRAEVDRRAEACADRARGVLLALPKRVAPELARMEDPAEIARALQVAIHRALLELAEGLELGGRERPCAPKARRRRPHSGGSLSSPRG